MAQVTLYMDDDTVARMRVAAEQAGLSMSAWLARLVRERTRTQWPDEVASLAGAWSDLPNAEELRESCAEGGRGCARAARVRGNADRSAGTLIAGVALANQGTLVTRNTREFGRVPGLLVENWYGGDR